MNPSGVVIDKLTTIVASKELSVAHLEDEAVILDMRSSQYYGLNKVGACVLEQVQEPVQVGALLSSLEGRYAVQAQDLERDVISFLQRLKQKGLIEVVE